MAESGKEPDKETGTPPRAPDERARARAYLDLWERHLVELCHSHEKSAEKPGQK